jgi:hypothetical protein
MKPLPPPKKETRWEQFAKEKGIQNRKRSRMVWDEEAQEWRPRWGYKRAKGGVEDMAIVEVKPVRACVRACMRVKRGVRRVDPGPSPLPFLSLHGG